jgi:hypothetical protein
VNKLSPAGWVKSGILIYFNAVIFNNIKNKEDV